MLIFLIAILSVLSVRTVVRYGICVIFNPNKQETSFREFSQFNLLKNNHQFILLVAGFIFEDIIFCCECLPTVCQFLISLKKKTPVQLAVCLLIKLAKLISVILLVLKKSK